MPRWYSTSRDLRRAGASTAVRRSLCSGISVNTTRTRRLLLAGGSPAYSSTSVIAARGSRAALEGALAQIAAAGGGLVEAISETTAGREAQDRFLFSATVELFEQHGFARGRQVGKHAWIVSRNIDPCTRRTGRTLRAQPDPPGQQLPDGHQRVTQITSTCTPDDPSECTAADSKHPTFRTHRRLSATSNKSLDQVSETADVNEAGRRHSLEVCSTAPKMSTGTTGLSASRALSPPI